MRPSAKEIIPGIVVLGLMLITVFCLANPRTLTGNPNGDVPFVFPDQLGPYQGEDLFFCMNDQCARPYRRTELVEFAANQEANPNLKHELEKKRQEFEVRVKEGKAALKSTIPPPENIPLENCPDCGAPLFTVSLGEIINLPPNTPIFHKIYTRPGHPDIAINLVFSGMERRSIHRPQVCLVSQGNRIFNEFVFRADNGMRKDFPLELLEARFERRDASGQTTANGSFVYAYWLFNPERETVSQYSRFFHMILDNCFRSYRPRWGYASISFPSDPRRPEDWKNEINDFLPHFYPLILDIRKKLDEDRNKETILSTSDTANQYEGNTEFLGGRKNKPNGLDRQMEPSDSSENESAIP